MKKSKIAIVLIIISFVLFVLNILEMNIENATLLSYTGPISNVLLILAMIVVIRSEKKR